MSLYITQIYLWFSSQMILLRNSFLYQVLCTVTFQRRTLYSFLIITRGNLFICSLACQSIFAKQEIYGIMVILAWISNDLC